MLKRVSYLDSELASVLPPEGEPITNLVKLVDAMGRVAALASEVGLPHIGRGFYGYQRVTKNTADRLDKGFFDDADKIARTMPVFAELAFKPLRHHINGETDQVGAWSPMYYSQRSISAPDSINMSEFLRAHVDRDLAFALLATDTQDKHRSDYTEKMNIILAETGRELMPEFVQVKSPFRQLGAEKIGLELVLRDLYNARDKAWDAFIELRSAGEDQDQIDLIDGRLSKKAASGLLSNNRLISYVINKTTNTPLQIDTIR